MIYSRIQRLKESAAKAMKLEMEKDRLEHEKEQRLREEAEKKRVEEKKREENKTVESLKDRKQLNLNIDFGSLIKRVLPKKQKKTPAKVTEVKEEPKLPEKPKSSKKHVFSASLGSFKKLIKSTRQLRRGTFIFLIVAGAICASQITIAYVPLAGIYVNAAALLVLLVLALLNSKARGLAISVGILPVANMVLLSVPRSDNFDQSIVIYSSILLLSLVYKYIFALDNPVKESKLSAKGYAIGVPIMLISGQLIGALGYAMLRHHYPYRGIHLPLVALSVIIFAFCEEVLFRGLIQEEAKKLLNPYLAGFLSAGLFALVNLNHSTVLPFIFAFIAGIFLVVVYEVKQNLVLTTSLNAAYKLVYLGLVATFILR